MAHPSMELASNISLSPLQHDIQSLYSSLENLNTSLSHQDFSILGMRKGFCDLCDSEEMLIILEDKVIYPQKQCIHEFCTVCFDSVISWEKEND